ncbi:hypothetical protein J4405_01045 [Candidatus Woesearchaeota archaeon]|nr:hypothetical protein [Candidatus Woesearchaeota archaeon]
MKFLIFIILFIFLAVNVSAHCPLCTVGIGAAAMGASWLGVNNIVIGLFIGAFAMSIGMWFSRLIKKKFIPYQNALIIIFIFLTTVLPLLKIMSYIPSDYYAFYLSLSGEYGSLLNRTYIFNLAFISSILGGIIVFLSPGISKKIKEKRQDKTVPFQTIIITLILLLIMTLIIQGGM